MIFKSLLPDIEIPAMGIYQYVTSNPNGISDDKVIFTDGITDKKLTYGELKSNSKKLAAGLIDKAGFKRGDVLAIISPNQVDYAIVSFGTIVAGYGLTEASPATHLAKIDNIVPGSVGKLISNLESKILSEDGKELGVDQPGELCVRGPNIMKGYLNNKEATDACIDGEGWLHTGDIVTVDKFGNFYLIDRAKELIKYKGFQVPPAELESILLTHTSIADAAVIGVYSEEHATEYPTAYVKLQPNVPQSDQLKKEIEDFIAQKVANYKRLRGGVLFIDQIPKSTSGKILRRSLRDRIKTEHPFYANNVG
ncbi:unnamed protein product [Rhizophagus irregularis]|uniref:Acetyl-CoA synthetase-like protein n=1 Tax=Rhizophagus irregularis TaxID=588596 RepID=A0A915ZCX9_9GLOM|nr:unnamed protein product [Rhizophagus irregularis]